MRKSLSSPARKRGLSRDLRGARRSADPSGGSTGTRRSSEPADPGRSGRAWLTRSALGVASAGVVGMGLRSGREAMPALGPATLDHESATLGPHANEESMSPSAVAIIGLERSLHCVIGSLRKVEPVMLSGNRARVKTRASDDRSRGPGRVMVAPLARQLSRPIPSPWSLALWLDLGNSFFDGALGF